MSLASGDEVPNIFTRKSRLQPGKILITSAKHFCNTICHNPTYAAQQFALFDHLVGVEIECYLESPTRKFTVRLSALCSGAAIESGETFL